MANMFTDFDECLTVQNSEEEKKPQYEIMFMGLVG